MDIIRTTSLCKSFGTTTAADHISIQVGQGEIYGFLGLNGAGKTTLIRMLLGMIRPNKGSIHLFGRELTPGFDLWNEVGYLVETPYAYPNLSVAENLQVYYTLRQLNDPALLTGIIDQLKLTRYKDKKANVLSLGNQQRLGLAKALMHRPRLLILDEPINGLDPEGIVEVRELLRTLAGQGTTIFLSSHILGEISRVAHRIGIIHRGKLIRELAAKELTDQVQKKVSVDTLDNISAAACLTRAGYKAAINGENEIEIFDPAAVAHPERLSKLLVEAGLPPKKVHVETEDLEMYFLRTIRNQDQP
jgi:ABC-2 type transport system ATP-binding protein